MSPASCHLTSLNYDQFFFFTGMVSSALLWGFIADVMGRRKILVWGFFADGICNILCGILSQNFAVIVVFKFFSGFMWVHPSVRVLTHKKLILQKNWFLVYRISGPYATIMTYCAEFYCIKDRPRVTLAVGFTCFAGCIVNAGKNNHIYKY